MLCHSFIEKLFCVKQFMLFSAHICTYLYAHVCGTTQEVQLLRGQQCKHLGLKEEIDIKDIYLSKYERNVLLLHIVTTTTKNTKKQQKEQIKKKKKRKQQEKKSI